MSNNKTPPELINYIYLEKNKLEEKIKRELSEKGLSENEINQLNRKADRLLKSTKITEDIIIYRRIICGIIFVILSIGSVGIMLSLRLPPGFFLLSIINLGVATIACKRIRERKQGFGILLDFIITLITALAISIITSPVIAFVTCLFIIK